MRARPVLTRTESFAVSFQQQGQHQRHFADSAGDKKPGDTTPKSFAERYGGYDPLAETSEEPEVPELPASQLGPSQSEKVRCRSWA
jgi:hypothetical protein